LWQKRLTEAKIWSADLVHLKGFEFLLRELNALSGARCQGWRIIDLDQSGNVN
jgi:hypothetical protein